MSNIWEGLNARHRAKLVERLYTLSKAVGDWNRRCQAHDMQACIAYGYLYFETDTLVNSLTARLNQPEASDNPTTPVTPGPAAWQPAIPHPAFTAAGIDARLTALAARLEEWAQACTAGQTVAWILVGQLGDHLESLWHELVRTQTGGN